MRKRWISVTLALSIAAIACVGLAVVSSGSARTGTKARWGSGASSVGATANRPAASKAVRANVTQTIVVTERYSNDDATVTPPTTSPTGVGGYDVFRDPLYNGSDTQVGHVLATCMPAFDGDSLCHGVLEFAGGNITIDGSGISTDGSLVLAITGGTGEYVGASGQVSINTAVSAAAARITISLTSG
jgi:hypothetical protein